MYIQQRVVYVLFSAFQEIDRARFLVDVALTAVLRVLLGGENAHLLQQYMPNTQQYVNNTFFSAFP